MTVDHSSAGNPPDLGRGADRFEPSGGEFLVGCPEGNSVAKGLAE